MYLYMYKQGLCKRCYNEVVKNKKFCEACLDRDCARKKKKLYTQFLEYRKMKEKQLQLLIQKGLARAPAPAGVQYCNACRKNLSLDNFDLTTSASLCCKHFGMKLKTASSAAAAPPPIPIAEVDDNVEYQYFEKFSSLDAALEFVEIIGHKESVMYLKRAQYNNRNFKITFRCHCAQKLYPPCRGMCCYPFYKRVKMVPHINLIQCRC